MKKKIVVGMLLGFGLCGVAVVLARPDWVGFGSERVVRKRAEAYWNARVANDLKAQAPYVHPLQKALQDNSILITETYEITGVKVDGDNALVGIKAKYRLKHPLMSKVEREISHDDKWVRYKGEWYHGLHPVGLGETLEQGLGRWKPPTESSAKAPVPPAPVSPAPKTSQ